MAYIVEGYYLRAPLSAVVDSGLFGLFGESRAIMVDLDDTETFRRLKKLRNGFPFGMFSPSVDFHDIKQVPEITQDEMPEHGRAWWLFQKFCDKVRGNARKLTFSEFEQFRKGRPKFRLVALVIFCPDSRPAFFEQLVKLSAV